jgi:hypothetical protein
MGSPWSEATWGSSLEPQLLAATGPVGWLDARESVVYKQAFGSASEIAAKADARGQRLRYPRPD